MEKQTRTNKYKDLRDSFKEEVHIDQKPLEEAPVEEDDFLAFLPKKEKKPSIDDTLEHPLSYETLKNDDAVESAINQAKINVGKEQYNTRMEILSRIKAENNENNVDVDDYRAKDFAKGHEVNDDPAKKMSLMEKLAAMSPEEDVEELRKYEDETMSNPAVRVYGEDPDQQKEEPVNHSYERPVNESYHEEESPMKEFVREPASQMSRENEPRMLSKKEIRALKKQEKQKQKELKAQENVMKEEAGEENSLVSKILNGVIIVLIIVFIVLCVFIVKDML